MEFTIDEFEDYTKMKGPELRREYVRLCLAFKEYVGNLGVELGRTPDISCPDETDVPKSRDGLVEALIDLNSSICLAGELEAMRRGEVAVV